MNEQKVKAILKEKDHIMCNVNRLARRGKKGLKFIIKEILQAFEAEECLDSIFSSTAELVFNAIKANYRFILTLDEIQKIREKEINEEKDVPELNKIKKDEDLFKEYMNKIPEDARIQERVREILSGEEKVSKIMQKAENENRSINKEEFNEIKRLLQMNARAKTMKVFVYINFSYAKDKLIVDIINNAPITNEGLSRIKDKRERYKKYVSENNVSQFYLENLDETESAGFGAAMVDARLYDFDIDPNKHFEIWGVQDKTAVTIAFPLDNCNQQKE